MWAGFEAWISIVWSALSAECAVATLAAIRDVTLNWN